MRIMDAHVRLPGDHARDCHQRRAPREYGREYEQESRGMQRRDLGDVHTRARADSAFAGPRRARGELSWRRRARSASPITRMVRKHVFPNVVSPMIVQLALTFGYAVIAEAGLSFLGVGVQAPTPSWGTMLQVGYNGIFTQQLPDPRPGSRDHVHGARRQPCRRRAARRDGPRGVHREGHRVIAEPPVLAGRGPDGRVRDGVGGWQAVVEDVSFDVAPRRGRRARRRERIAASRCRRSR